MPEEKVRGASYGSAELPLFGEADVVIAGAGPGRLGAGMGAAMAAQDIFPAEVDGCEVRLKLIEFGANLKES